MIVIMHIKILATLWLNPTKAWKCNFGDASMNSEMISKINLEIISEFISEIISKVQFWRSFQR